MNAPTAYQSFIQKSAASNGVDAKLIDSIMAGESSYAKGATSSAGASGLMQLMPDTAKGLGVTNIYDPAQNIEGGTKYISQMLSKYKNNMELALAAYNAGPGRVDQAIKKAGGSHSWPEVSKYLPKETQDYVPKVLKKYYS